MANLLNPLFMLREFPKWFKLAVRFCVESFEDELLPTDGATLGLRPTFDRWLPRASAPHPNSLSFQLQGIPQSDLSVASSLASKMTSSSMSFCSGVREPIQSEI